MQRGENIKSNASMGIFNTAIMILCTILADYSRKTAHFPVCYFHKLQMICCFFSEKCDVATEVLPANTDNLTHKPINPLRGPSDMNHCWINVAASGHVIPLHSDTPRLFKWQLAPGFRAAPSCPHLHSLNSKLCAAPAWKWTAICRSKIYKSKYLSQTWFSNKPYLQCT